MYMYIRTCIFFNTCQDVKIKIKVPKVPPIQLTNELEWMDVHSFFQMGQANRQKERRSQLLYAAFKGFKPRQGIANVFFTFITTNLGFASLFICFVSLKES